MNLTRALLSVLCATLFTGGAVAATASNNSSSTVVNAAPAFSGGASVGKNISLTSLRGKPVFLVIAPSPRDRAFCKQMKEFRGYYERLAAQGSIAFAAFTVEGGRVPSNIPFILVNDPASTAVAYDVQNGFAIAVIGRDGNLDCLSTKPIPGYRLLDLVMNNAEMQQLLRR